MPSSTGRIQSLAEVRDAFREPLVLFYLDCLNYREIAEILAVPIGTL